MKALTICQPFAHLIVVTKEKRVENRRWRTDFRGDVLIHAGKSRLWLGQGGINVVETFAGASRRRISTSDMQGREIAFGAIIGVAKIIDCVHIDDVQAGRYDEKYPWLREHRHTEGPWCWVLDEKVLQLPTPVPHKGALGLFNVAFERDKGPCMSCGCTWSRACPGGCHWVAPNLCSSCVEGAHESH